MLNEIKRISYSYGESSIVGKANEGGINEDSQSSYVPPSLKLPGADVKGIFCIADGFGDPGLGDAASRETVNLVKEVIVSGEYIKWAKSRGIESRDFLKVLCATVYQINYVINNYAAKHNRKMGTTLEALVFKGNRFYLAHVGNSRIYLMRKGIVYRLTQDHVVDEAAATPDAPVNLLGMAPKVTVDVFSDEVQPDDNFILCTDGLTASVSEEEIKYALVNTETPHEAATKLTRLADRRDGSDNISVTIVSATHPGREMRPPVKRKPAVTKTEAVPAHAAKRKPPHKKTEIEEPAWKSIARNRTVLISAISVLTVALIVLIIWKVVKSPPVDFMAKPDAKNIMLVIENIQREERYYIYRQEGRPFEAKTTKVPTSPKTLTQLTAEEAQYIDDTVEPDKTYYYTAYRVITAWGEELDLESMMIEGPIVVGGVAVVSIGKETGDEKDTIIDAPGKFNEIYNTYIRLKREYGGGLSAEQKDDFLETVRDYKKTIEEIDQFIQELIPLEVKTDLLIDNTISPRSLKGNLIELKETMYKTIPDEGFVLYFKRLRQKALRTDFLDTPSIELSMIKDEIRTTPWKTFTPEFDLFLKILDINSDIHEKFVPPGTVDYTVEIKGEEVREVLKKFFSEEKAKSKKLVDRFFQLNEDVTPGEPFSIGTKLIIPGPEFERGGDKLLELQDELIGSPSYYYYAIKLTDDIEDDSLKQEYKQLVELFRIKVLFWYAINQNSRTLKKQLLDINTFRTADIELYKDSFIKNVVVSKINELEGIVVTTDESIIEKEKKAADELERLGKIFQTIDPNEESETFIKAVEDFRNLKKWVMDEKDPRFDSIKELVIAQEENVEFISGKITGKEEEYITRADNLVEEVGDISRLTEEYDTAAGKLKKAASLYEDAILLAKSAEESTVLREKIEAVNEKIGLIQSKTVEGEIAGARWNRGITELSFSEVLIYLQKLTGEDDEIVDSYRRNYPEAYSFEVKATQKRANELKELSASRIIRRLDPSGPEFDDKNFQKAIAEFKFLSFALTAIIEDEKYARELESGIADLTEHVKDGILQNHLSFEGAGNIFTRSFRAAMGVANVDINERFGGKMDQAELRRKIIDNEGDKYIDSVREFAASIGERIEEYPVGRRESYFVEVLLPPREDDALAAARIIWDNNYPLLRLKFIGARRHARGKNYQLSIGWYKTREDAEEASTAIQRIPAIFKYIFSVSVLDKSTY